MHQKVGNPTFAHMHEMHVNVHTQVFIFFLLLSSAELGGGEENQSCSRSPMNTLNHLALVHACGNALWPET